MKTLFTVLLALCLSGFAAVLIAQDTSPSKIEVDCSWGKLTMEAIEDGVNMGEHSSDFPTPRVGLGNVIERGNLQATCEFIASQI
jgi:hypothetical protein